MKLQGMIWAGVVAVVAVGAVVVYKLYDIRLPKEASGTLPLRIGLTLFKLRWLKADLYGFLYGKEVKYQTWIKGARRFPYSAKPDRTEEGLKIRDLTFDGVPVRTYEPLSREPNSPAVVFIHGGGWIVGSVEKYDSITREWAKDLNMMVASIEYRLAPEHLYPAPFQDCFSATKFFIEHAKDFDVDPERIAIAGDSAGGTLSAAVSLKLRDTQVKPQPKLQVLIYPVTQPLDFNLPSYLENVDDPVLPKETMVAMWLLYAQGSTDGLEDAMQNKHVSKEVKTEMTSILNHDIITGKTGSTPEPTEGNNTLWQKLKDVLLDPYFAPLLAENLEDLPPAFVYTAEQDVLKDDGFLFVHRLKEAGNKVEHYNNKAALHGLNSIAERELPSQDLVNSNARIRNFIKENL